MLVIKSSAELKRLRKCERVRDDDTRIVLDIWSDKIKNIHVQMDREPSDA